MGRWETCPRSPFQACQPCKGLPPLKSSPETLKALPFWKAFLVEECVCAGMCTYLGEDGARANALRSGRPTNCTFKCSLSQCCAPQRAAFFKQKENLALYPLLHPQTSGYPTFPAGLRKNTHQHTLIRCLQASKSNTGEAFYINLFLFQSSFLSVPCAHTVFSRPLFLLHLKFVQHATKFSILIICENFCFPVSLWKLLIHMNRKPCGNQPPSFC